MYVYVHMYVVHTAHEYARTHMLRCQYEWTKSTNIKTFKCDGDLVLYRGGGGGVVRLVRLKCTQACPWDNSVLCSNEESSHISAGTNCDATEPSC